MAVQERARRLIGNVWQYVTAEENGDGNGTPPDLATVLAVGNDGDQVGAANLGSLDLGDATLSGVLTLVMSTNGTISTIGGNVETGGGAVNTDGGDVSLNGGAVNLSNSVWSDAGLNTFGGNITTEGGTGDGNVTIKGALDHNSATVGFYGTAPAAQPQVPAIATAQDIVDTLVTLGLITQAS